MRDVPFSSTDFELFNPDLTPQDYEFFQKHKGAFKSLLEDQTQEQKQKFVSAFREFSINNGCIKEFPIKSDQANVLGFVDHVIQHLKENFVNGKVSKAKCLVQDAVVLAQNRSLIHHVGSSSYAKDPFIHKDTRDVFRRLFGEPSEKDAALKAMCLFPLYVKFGGAVCRYLRRWLEAGKLDEPGANSVTAMPSQQKSNSVSSSSESKQTTTTKETKENNTTAVSQSVNKAVPSSEPRSSTGPSVTLATINKDGELEFLGSSDDDDNDNDDDEEDSWETKVIRGIQSVLTDRAGPSAIDYMEVYKRHKDGSYRRLRDQLHLGKPHPNQEFEERCRKKEEEVIEGSRLHEVILKDYAESGRKKHACANCRQVERYAGTFKKCQRCKGKGTKFYCSRKCQGEDWVCRHRMQHSTVELPS